MRQVEDAELLLEPACRNRRGIGVIGHCNRAHNVGMCHGIEALACMGVPHFPIDDEYLTRGKG